ncbi:ROK family protein [Leifsonia poae]|uniref:ROK family protein n=1 Tax=Leifsonia poae TaxID=110933 RepID=UPI003D675824
MTVLCVDFGGTEIKLGMLDDANILTSATLPNTGNEADLDAVRDAAFRMSTASESPIDAVGIAVPGVVDRKRGALVAAHDKYDWATGRDLRVWATETFDVPAVIENDARAALLGETTFGCAAGETDAVLVTLGTGIGTAALIDGVLLRGAHDHAGILGGHITVDIDGPVCNCGNTGCAEAIASTWALRRDAAADPVLAAALGTEAQHLGIKDLIAHADHPVVAPVLDRYLRAWGAAIVGVCHAYDPDVVIVSGGVMRSADVLLPRLTEYVHSHLWSSSFRPPLLTPDAPEHSVLLGLSAAAPRKDLP